MADHLKSAVAIFMYFLSCPSYADTQSEFDAFLQEQQVELNSSSEQEDFTRYVEELEAGFAAYQQAYEKAFTAYKKSIMQQWGEFREGNPQTWISYVDNNHVRRVVDFENGQVEVSLLAKKGVAISDVEARIGGHIHQLLNSTEADAFEHDPLAKNVEHHLLNQGDLVKRGIPSQQRLFSFDDLAAITFTDGVFQGSCRLFI